MPGPTLIHHTCATHLQFLQNSLAMLLVRASCLHTGHRALFQPGAKQRSCSINSLLTHLPKTTGGGGFHCSVYSSTAFLDFMGSASGCKQEREKRERIKHPHCSQASFPHQRNRTIQLVCMGCSQNYGPLMVMHCTQYLGVSKWDPDLGNYPYEQQWLPK